MTTTTACKPSADLVRSVLKVWAQIGFDCEADCEDNECAIEQCIDADRLHPDMGFLEDGGAAQRELRTLIATHGYPSVLRALAQRLTLV